MDMGRSGLEKRENEMTHEAGIEAAWTELNEADKSSVLLEDDVEAAIQAYLSASGMVLVPKEATMEMKGYGSTCTYQWESELRPSEAGKVFEAMIAAAPDPFKSKPGE